MGVELSVKWGWCRVFSATKLAVWCPAMHLVSWHVMYPELTLWGSYHHLIIIAGQKRVWIFSPAAAWPVSGAGHLSPYVLCPVTVKCRAPPGPEWDRVRSDHRLMSGGASKRRTLSPETSAWDLIVTANTNTWHGVTLCTDNVTVMCFLNLQNLIDTKVDSE